MKMPGKQKGTIEWFALSDHSPPPPDRRGPPYLLYVSWLPVYPVVGRRTTDRKNNPCWKIPGVNVIESDVLAYADFPPLPSFPSR